VDLVVLGGALAVPFTRNPLYAGLNSFWRIIPEKQIVLAGRHATDPHEPRQVRKEAAISDVVCVVDRSRPCYDSTFLEYSIASAQPGLIPTNFSIS
jgi:hypothetical protein